MPLHFSPSLPLSFPNLSRPLASRHVTDNNPVHNDATTRDDKCPDEPLRKIAEGRRYEARTSSHDRYGFQSDRLWWREEALPQALPDPNPRTNQPPSNLPAPRERECLNELLKKIAEGRRYEARTSSHYRYGFQSDRLRRREEALSYVRHTHPPTLVLPPPPPISTYGASNVATHSFKQRPLSSLLRAGCVALPT